MNNQALTTVCEQLGVVKQTPVTGGSINECFCLETESGRQYFLKVNEHMPAAFFEKEQTGLLELSHCARVPRVVALGNRHLVLEWIEAGSWANKGWQDLAEQLANLHSQRAQVFGFLEDNYCGENPQFNPKNEDGFDFFAQQRLMVQARWAREKDLLTTQEVNQVSALGQNLKNWIPEQEPARIHGDLWSGNILVNQQQQAFLVDPACYWGWPEADIAMSHLFGGFGDAFYQHYQTLFPFEPGFSERVPLYNLYHLLNHLNLFGGSYHSSVMAVLKRFA